MPASFATTVSGQTLGLARSSASMSVNHPPHLLRARPVDEAHRGREADPVAGSEVLDPHVGEPAVREADERPVQRADLGRAHADALHVAGEVLDLHEIAHPEGLVGGERDRAEEVLDRLLGAEGEGEAADAEPGEDGRHRVAEGGEGGHHAADPHEQLGEVAGHGEERPGGGVLRRPGPLHEELGPDVHRAPQGPEDGDRGGPAEERPDGAVGLGQQREPGQQHGGHRHRPQEGEGRRGPLRAGARPTRSGCAWKIRCRTAVVKTPRTRPRTRARARRAGRASHCHHMRPAGP